MSFSDKLDLYFHDYNMAGLFAQENYLRSKPASVYGERKLMQLVSKAADSLAEGDLVEKYIRMIGRCRGYDGNGRQRWRGR